jgi:hypothetical protein
MSDKKSEAERMSEIPTRSKATAAAMAVAVRREKSDSWPGFEIGNVIEEAGFFSDSATRSTRRALRDLELLGYLKRKTDGGHTWLPGDRIGELLEDGVEE